MARLLYELGKSLFVAAAVLAALEYAYDGWRAAAENRTGTAATQRAYTPKRSHTQLDVHATLHRLAQQLRKEKPL
jgi:hypothetical protein